VQAKTPIVQRAPRHAPWGAAHMRLEKKEIFVGLNGINIGKENVLRAGLYNSPNSSGGQRRKSMEWRNYSRRHPNCTLFLLIAGMGSLLLPTSSCLITIFHCTLAWLCHQIA
jgi:hypothetical protein